MDNYSTQILKIVDQAVDKKMYGSIEIYFESGKVTQITQRIINKIRKHEEAKKEDIKIIRHTSTNKVNGGFEDQNTPLTS